MPDCWTRKNKSSDEKIDYLMEKHLLIVRTGGSIIDIDSYNCQELGLAKALSDKGLKVSLVLASDENQKKEICFNGRVIDVYKIRFWSVNQALAWFDNIERLMMTINPDIIQIHEFGMLMSWRVVKWAKKRKIPTVLIQGSYRPTQKIIFKQLELLFNFTFGKYVLNNVSAIGYKTLWAANYIKKYTPKKCLPSFIGIDISRFEDAKSVEWREKLKLDANSKILLYVGKIEQRRNPHFLIDIMECLDSEYKLIIVGNGPMYDEIKNRISENKLTDKCLMLGKLSQKDLPSLYLCSDLLLLPSNYEIYGMVILEAMYFSVPVISTHTAGADTIITNSKDGVVINNLNPQKWSNEIKSIFEDKNRLADLKRNAFEKIKSSLTWNSTSDLFLKIYEIGLKDNMNEK